MQTATPSESYHAVARWLHWLMAATIVFMMLIVIFREAIDKEWGWRTMGLHKSLGFLILGLTLARIGWRRWRPPPPADPAIGATVQRLAHAVHVALYAMMLVLPILGYLTSSAGPFPLSFFMIPVAKLDIAKNSMLAQWSETGHVVGGYTMAALVAGHAFAALYHHFILKDSTLRRMLGSRAV